jgi:hypothetical protein
LSSNCWLGKVTPSADGQFEQFKSVEYGIRAAFIILRTYIRRHGVKTITQLIERFAPATENNVTAYVNRVCDLSKTSLNEPLRFERRLQMCTILWAMHVVECGKSYYPLPSFINVYDKYFYVSPSLSSSR